MPPVWQHLAKFAKSLEIAAQVCDQRQFKEVAALPAFKQHVIKCRTEDRQLGRLMKGLVPEEALFQYFRSKQDSAADASDARSKRSSAAINASVPAGGHPTPDPRAKKKAKVSRK